MRNPGEAKVTNELLEFLEIMMGEAVKVHNLSDPLVIKIADALRAVQALADYQETVG